DAGQQGTLVKVYPQIAGGRVLADVEVDGLDGRFIGRRVPVRVPVGEHDALLVPETALSQQAGLDFVTIQAGDHTVQRTVVPGSRVMMGDVAMVEILSGLAAGDKVVTDHE
ncbi:efflux transporter periplasmic adaptor subunit, partial [Escherichia coli]|nr:efflux transporter periplasmic adaptor subunit [Escherichia coli]